MGFSESDTVVIQLPFASFFRTNKKSFFSKIGFSVSTANCAPVSPDDPRKEMQPAFRQLASSAECIVIRLPSLDPILNSEEYFEKNIMPASIFHLVGHLDQAETQRPLRLVSHESRSQSDDFHIHHT